ncbi:MAG TPA: DUF4236 domain-containing protein, partial [Nitrococcus sp.]|nr:DUF4236 domain-containing protein [Nitrococcus sp.]
RTIKLAPGLHLNIGKRGVSLSAGVRGASITLGRNGAYVNAGLPGTGLSVRERIGGGGKKSHFWKSRSAPPESAVAAVKAQLEDGGTVRFLDALDNPLPPALERKAEEQQDPLLRNWLEEQCQKRNALLRELQSIHECTPSPDFAAPEPRPFAEQPPAPTAPKKAGFLGFFLSRRRQAIEQENRDAQQRFADAQRRWEARKQAHEQAEQHRIHEQMVRLKSEVAVMEQALFDRLQGIEWPRETNIAFELLQGGWMLALDVDLPEIEDFPTEEASVAARGLRLNLKKLSQTRQHEIYSRHVHGVALRLLGEAFAALPSLKQVVISGYTQRINKATGHETNTYIYSAVVPRTNWAMLNFSNLASVDPIQALEMFDLRRNMTVTGILRAIEPFDPQLVAESPVPREPRIQSAQPGFGHDSAR